MKLDHVRLLVDDFGEAYAFYRDRLGLTVTYGDEDGPYASFDTGDASLSIFTRAGQDDVVRLRPAGDGTLTVIRVDDVDATAASLGLDDPVAKEEWGIRVAYVRDPAGNLLEFYSPLPERA